MMRNAFPSRFPILIIPVLLVGHILEGRKVPLDGAHHRYVKQRFRLAGEHIELHDTFFA
jgi:hypothetical protein